MATKRPGFTGTIAATVAALALVLALAPAIASAHAKLQSSTPADGSTVPAGLTQISMTLEEETSVDQSNAQLLDANGQPVAGATFAVDKANRTQMSITTPALGPGKYTVKYKTVTEDDNGIVNGSFSFTVAGDTSRGTGNTASATATTGTSTSTNSGTASASPTAMPDGTNSSLPATGDASNTPLWTIVAITFAGLLLASGILARRKSSTRP